MQAMHAGELNIRGLRPVVPAPSQTHNGWYMRVNVCQCAYYRHIIACKRTGLVPVAGGVSFSPLRSEDLWTGFSRLSTKGVLFIVLIWRSSNSLIVRFHWPLQPFPGWLGCHGRQEPILATWNSSQQLRGKHREMQVCRTREA
jgi:hypothetical protein